MAMSISELYDYVFGDKAKKPTLSERTELSPEQQQKKAARDEAKEARKKADFQFITSNPQRSQAFRKLLRTEGSLDLERLLYDNTTDALEETPRSRRHKMPAPEVMGEEFKRLNREYSYFDETSLETFIQLVKASKLIADFLEDNNSADNAVAYMHAYKMMVLFKINTVSPLSGINQYIDKHWKDEHEDEHEPKPIHNALVLPIPKNIPPLQHLSKWRVLIMQHGPKALSLFQQAQAIEPNLEGPMTLSTVQKAAVQIKYKQYASNPELALLCEQYHVSEEDFDKCLTIIPKQTDQLPEVMVDGASLGHPGYCLVKLPISDPRAYILGHITNCCQSIGGQTEECVIDGITREHNGFYVLLKANPKAHEPPIIDGKINHANHEIVGQGYAWLSELDNLTFDSWENLTPSTDDKVIVDLLGAFAQQCFERKPSVGRVTIGLGGKTPVAYAMATPYPEKIAEGFQYHDSFQQTTLAINPALLKETARINEKLKAVRVALSFELFSMKQIEWFESLLTKDALQRYNDPIEELPYQELLEKAATHPHYLAVITFLHQANLLTKSTADLILYLQDWRVRSMTAALSTLRKINPALVNDENFELLAWDAEYNNHMADALSTLFAANPALINDENFKLLSQSVQYANKMAEALSFLYKANPLLLCDDNRKLLALSGQYTDNMAHTLYYLFEANPALINDDNRELLTKARDAYYLTDAVFILYETNLTLVNDENFKLLAQNAKEANHMARALSTLYKANPAFINDENRKRLAHNAQYSHRIAMALSTLYGSNPALVNIENCNLLFQNAPCAYATASALSTLHQGDPTLVNDENRELLAHNAQHAHKMDSALLALQRTAPALVNDKNFKLLAQKASYSDTMAEILSTLYKANQALVNDNNRALLVLNEEDASCMGRALSILCGLNREYYNTAAGVRSLPRSAEKAYDRARQAATTQDKTNLALLNDENFKLLAQNLPYAEKIAWVLSALDGTSPSLFTHENREIIAQNKQHSYGMAREILILRQVNPTLVNDENFKLMAQNAQYADHMADVLSILYAVYPDIINEENFKLLAQNAAFASTIFKALEALYESQPRSINNKSFKKLIADMVPPAGPSTRALGQLGLFSSPPHGLEKAAEQTLEKDADSEKSKKPSDSPL